MASPVSTQTNAGTQRRRRTSSVASRNTSFPNLAASQSSSDPTGSSSGTGGHAQPLSTIPGTPYDGMSLSRSPSPRLGGGWSTPGLTSPYETGNAYTDLNGSAGTSVTWESAKARSNEVKGYPSFSTKNQGFFSRHARKISTSLPTFSLSKRDYSDKEKLGRGRWPASRTGKTGRFLTTFGRMLWRGRLRLGVVLGLILAFVLFYATREFRGLSSFIQMYANGDTSFAPCLSKNILARRWQ